MVSEPEQSNDPLILAIDKIVMTLDHVKAVRGKPGEAAAQEYFRQAVAHFDELVENEE